MGKFHGQCLEDTVCKQCGQRCCKWCREGFPPLCPECALIQRRERAVAAKRLAAAYWPQKESP
jgi:hypothetical protein